MRPSPAETIAGVRRILRDEVEPHVTGEFARARLKEVRAVLAQVDWNDAALKLDLTNRRTLAVLVGARSWADANVDRADSVARTCPNFHEVVQRDATQDNNSLSFAELNEKHRRLSAASIELHAYLGAYLPDNQHDVAAVELRSTLQELYAAPSERT